MRLFSNVLDIVKYTENELNYDVETKNHYYEVNYGNNQLVVYIIEEYYKDGDEWREVFTKCNKRKIKSIDCSISEYLNFVIFFFKQKITYIEYEYPEENEEILMIDIKGEHL